MNDKRYLVLGADNNWYDTCETIDEAITSVSNLTDKFMKEGEWPSEIIIFEAVQISSKELW